MAVNQLSKKDVDGTVVGQDATDKLSFYGKTPVVQPAHTDQAAITAGATATATTALVVQIQAALVSLGLIKGSA